MGLRPPKLFGSPKAGNRLEECEDSVCVRYPFLGPAGKVAISDGASESAFAGSWSQILSNAFVRDPIDFADPDGFSFEQWLKPHQEEWSRRVPWEKIPWHGEVKTRAGAMATLLGLTVDMTPSSSMTYPWRAIGVGDCCLFVVRNNSLLLSFPIEKSGEFNSTPALICSNPANNKNIDTQIQWREGKGEPGDVLLVTSDALAHWILKESELGQRPWENLLALQSSEWEVWLQARRNERSLRNDDTTLLIIPIE